MYQPRRYREGLNAERFSFFPSVYRESDLYIGVSPGDYREEMPALCQDEQVRLYRLMSAYGQQNPLFLTSLEPLMEDGGDRGMAPEIATMIRCGVRTGTGPMSAVAGLFASRVAERLHREYRLRELVVENGGDLYIRSIEELVSVIHAGDSPLSGKLGLLLPPGTRGVCTSSGTVGHSFSKGKADAVTVVCNDVPLADAWATALANGVQGPEDIDRVLERVHTIPEILACVVIAGERMGIRGEFEIKPLS